MRNHLRHALGAVAMIVSTPAISASIEISDDWRNPVFEYGYGNVGTTFVPIPVPSNDGTFEAFRGPPGTNIFIGKNITGAPVVAGDFFFSTGGVAISPGELGLDSIIRFIAPAAGNFAVAGTLTPVWNTTGGNGLDLILYSGSTLIGNATQPANSFGTVQSFSFNGIQLGAGDTLDFGFDSRGDLAFDITEFAATIGLKSAVPEPSSWMMMILGFGMVGSAMRRRSIGRQGYA